MNPRTIFSAVAAVCLMMILILPRLAVSSRANGEEIQSPAAAAVAGAAMDALAVQSQATPLPTELPVVVAETAVPPAEALPEGTLAPFDIPIQEPPPAAQQAAPVAPDLQTFAAAVTNGDPAAVTGVYAEGIFALQVRQQPYDNYNYIADEDGTVTQYARPTQFGVTGLLAHNTLSGRLFFKLRNDNQLTLVFGDGRLVHYRIRELQNYQALSPYDTRSDFVDLNNPSAQLLSHTELYQRVYTSPATLVLQTCIEANGEPTWGRLFVIADPL